MLIQCPQCGSSVDDPERSDADTACPSCGATFARDEEQRTRTFVAEQRRIGKFTLIEQVGSGAFGAVWKARDCELGRVVALKIPHNGQFGSDREAQRFNREARSAAQLRHPGIVSLHEVGHFEGLPYLVSEFVQGLTLSEYLEGHQPGHRESAELVAHVADALEYAHSLGVVHRDVKPSNIMLERGGSRSGSSHSNSTDRPLLMDFGLALRADAEATMTQEGEVLGTPAYMSPEQAAGQSHGVDARSDIYSLGVVLYRLLTGRLPFQGSARVILDHLLHDEPATPRSVDRSISRDLETICLKAMAKTSVNRYRSARELGDDLRRYLAGEPISARRVAFWERAWRWARRRPAAAAAVGLGAIASLTLVGLGVALAYQSQLRVKNAEVERALRGERDARAGERRAGYYNMLISADRELQENNSYLAETLLARCPQEHRNWEWHYLKRQCHTELLSITGHDGTVYAVAYSPDGSLVASAGDDNIVRVWDAETGREVRSFQDHDQLISSLAFSPDGTRLASLSGWMKEPALLRIYDSTTGRRALDIPVPSGTLAGLCYSGDGKLLAVASGETDENGWVRIFDTHTGQELRRLDLPVKGAYSPSFSPDGSRVAAVVGLANTSSEMTPNAVSVWDVATGAEVRHLGGHTAPIMSAAFSPDGQAVASGGYDGTVRVWDTSTGRERLVFRGHSDTVNRLVFSPDGSRIATASDDGSALVWDSGTGDILLRLRGHRGPFWSIAFSPDGRRIVTGGSDGRLKLWDAVSPRFGLTQRVSDTSVEALVLSPDGHYLATGGQDRKLRVWKVYPSRLELVWSAAHADPIWGIAYDPGGTRLATASGDWQREEPGEVRVWNATSGRPLHTMPAHRGIAWCVAFSADGTQLASGGGEARTSDQEVIIWDVETGRRQRSFPHLEGGARALALSPDGRKIAAAIGKRVRVWDARTEEEIVVLEGHEANVTGLAFHRDSLQLLSCGEDMTVRAWDVTTGRLGNTLWGHKSLVLSVTYSPDGTRAASSSIDRTVRVWDIQAGQELFALRGHTGYVKKLVFSFDGRILYSCDHNGFVRAWDGTPVAGEDP